MDGTCAVSERQDTTSLFTGTAREREWLQALSSEMGPCRLQGSAIEKEFVEAVRKRARADKEMDRLQAVAKETLNTIREASGYLVIDQLLPDPDNELQFTRAATILASLLGQPFHMSLRQALWEILGVNLAQEPYRFGGIGYNPLHIDGVNTTFPPDYLILLCRREDPAGGGASLLSNLQRAVEELDEYDRIYLQQPIFEEGQFYDLEGVGEEYRPFPVLHQFPDKMWRVRVTGKMLPAMPPSQSKSVLERLLAILEKNKEIVHLRPGQALVVNQLLNAHGRLPLGEGQEKIPSSERRDYRQGFIRPDQFSFISSYLYAEASALQKS
jgi:TfdA family taurine catabolism dioxygenase TauD